MSFVALFMMFGGLLVPFKAVVLNLLSLTATFGAMVYIFQEGHGQGTLDFTTTGTLVATTPILMFCIAFGLSMDTLMRMQNSYDIAQTRKRAGEVDVKPFMTKPSGQAAI